MNVAVIAVIGPNKCYPYKITDTACSLDDTFVSKNWCCVPSFQMIQDDESDELEMGSEEISKLLGDHQHHYQKILYLVMADAAYCEGIQQPIYFPKNISNITKSSTS